MNQQESVAGLSGHSLLTALSINLVIGTAAGTEYNRLDYRHRPNQFHFGLLLNKIIGFMLHFRT